MAEENSVEDILEVMERFPQGASIEEVMLGLSVPVARRTLQRRLAEQIQRGVLEVVGKGKALRYRVIKTPQEKLPTERIVVLSEEGKEIEQLVCQPIERRKRVSYRREFLESYQPNHTFYLSQTEREALRTLGTGPGPMPAGTYAKQILNRLLIDLSWNSSRLEGNTYSLLETERLIERGIVAKGKDLRETQMILNHKAAIEFLIHSAEEIGLNRYTVLNLHTLLSEHLLEDPMSCGRLRSIAVGISHSVYLPSAIPQVIDECFRLILDKGAQIQDPFEQALFLMVHLPYLQPFDDVNKRTSRLSANIALIKHNLCPLSFVGVPDRQYIHALLGVYELNRIELLRDLFVWAYERSCVKYGLTRNVLGDPDPFRLEIRKLLNQTIRSIVLQCFNQEQAIAEIRKTAHQFPKEKRDRFIQIAEQELLSLHLGNIARFQLRPAEWERWLETWR